MTTTAEARGDLAEQMLPVAAYLSTVVHGDGGDRDVHQELSRLDDAQRDALIVVLAGLVNPDRPLAALLGWVDFDENGDPIEAAVDCTETLRDIAEEYAPLTAPADIDDIAIRRALEGEQVTLTKRERDVAYAEGRRRGWEGPEIAAVLGGNRSTLARSWERAKDKARANGKPDPSLADAFRVAA